MVRITTLVIISGDQQTKKDIEDLARDLGHTNSSLIRSLIEIARGSKDLQEKIKAMKSNKYNRSTQSNRYNGPKLEILIEQANTLLWSLKFNEFFDLCKRIEALYQPGNLRIKLGAITSKYRNTLMDKSGV